MFLSMTPFLLPLSILPLTPSQAVFLAKNLRCQKSICPPPFHSDRHSFLSDDQVTQLSSTWPYRISADILSATRPDVFDSHAPSIYVEMVLILQWSFNFKSKTNSLPLTHQLRRQKTTRTLSTLSQPTPHCCVICLDAPENNRKRFSFGDVLQLGLAKTFSGNLFVDNFVISLIGWF